MKHRNYLLLILLISSLMVSDNVMSTLKIGSHSIVPQGLYTTHDPIRITSNAEFATAGFIGDGTALNPYIIAGFNITGNDTAILISIFNTSAYFTIRNNYLSSGAIAIYVDATVHGYIYQNIVTDVAEGIQIIDSVNTVLSWNSISPNLHNGIFSYNSTEILVANNTIITAPNYAIESQKITNSTIAENYLANNTYGVSLVDAANSILTENTFINNEKALSISNSEAIDIIANDFIYNTVQATDIDGTGNYFDSNYWSDWISPDSNKDGVVDTSYYFIENKDSNPQTSPILNENTIPLLSIASDIKYAEGVTGNVIEWQVGDAHPGIYYASVNGLSNVGGKDYGVAQPWTNGTITINIDGLAKGTYNFTIYVRDAFGNTAVDVIVIIVSDLKIPTISSPADIIYVEGTKGNIIKWQVEDLHAGQYNVTIDGKMYIPTTSWVTGSIDINIDKLQVATYNFTILVWDTSNNMATDSVTVRVVADKVAPTISSPADFSYIEGASGNIIKWQVGDLNPFQYNITMNDKAYQNPTLWTNGTISIAIDGLTQGTYVFTIYVVDAFGNIAIDTVVVTVNAATTEPINNTGTDEASPTTQFIIGLVVTFFIVTLLRRKNKLNR